MSEENTNVVVNTDTSETSVNAENSHEGEVGVETPSLADLQAQIQNLTVTNAKLKRANDKLASENGDLNKKYREKLSDDERRSLEIAENEAKREEEFNAMRDQINALNKEKAISNATNSYLSMGWTKDEASRMAIADADNNFEERMKIMSEVQERQKKEYDVEVLKNRKPVQVGTGSSADITKEQFDKMGYMEMLEFKRNNPEMYGQFAD